jgi:L-lactate dehydrogenase complex protein LldG
MYATFQAAAEAVGSIVKHFTNYADAIAYLSDQFDGPVAASALPAQLRESLAPLGFAPPTAYATTRLAVSVAEAGIAATGSLLLDLADPTERSATALAPIHAVFLRASTIVPTLTALGETLSQRLTTPGSSYLSITTGPSRTADIERVLTIGVHGPKELHILLLDNE